jgi:hypothetical protein
MPQIAAKRDGKTCRLAKNLRPGPIFALAIGTPLFILNRFGMRRRTPATNRLKRNAIHPPNLEDYPRSDVGDNAGTRIRSPLTQ